MRSGVVVDRARVEQSQGRKVMGIDGRVSNAEVQEVFDVRHEADSVSTLTSRAERVRETAVWWDVRQSGSADAEKEGPFCGPGSVASCPDTG